MKNMDTGLWPILTVENMWVNSRMGELRVDEIYIQKYSPHEPGGDDETRTRDLRRDRQYKLIEQEQEIIAKSIHSKNVGD